MGSYDIEISMCFTCYRTEWNWRVCYEGDYTCANCKDLTSFDLQRKAFIKMHHHLTGVLPHPLSLSSLFEHLYPISYKHTRIQRQQTLRCFLLGAPHTSNFFNDLRIKAWEQRRGIRRGGKNYRQLSWDNETDFITAVCDFLI